MTDGSNRTAWVRLGIFAPGWAAPGFFTADFIFGVFTAVAR